MATFVCVVVELPVANLKMKFGELPQLKSTVLVILNFPNLKPGGGGQTEAILAGVAIAEIILICLLVALIFQLGPC